MVDERINVQEDFRGHHPAPQGHDAREVERRLGRHNEERHRRKHLELDQA